MDVNDLAVDAGRRLDRLRARRPLVQAITNYVSMDAAANVLLAVGASPAMVHAIEEVEAFVGFADALVINIGTLSTPWIDSMARAAEFAQAGAVPWVLDPVGVGATRFRDETCAMLLESRPTAIRGNASEIMALARIAGASVASGRGKGVDSGDAVEQAEGAARALARAVGAVVSATGEVDFVTDGARHARISGGHALMPQVTALGCALSGVVAAFLSARDDAFAATVAAHGVFAVAGASAGAGAQGPGSFRVAFLDALAAVTPEQVATRMRIST